MGRNQIIPVFDNFARSELVSTTCGGLAGDFVYSWNEISLEEGY